MSASLKIEIGALQTALLAVVADIGGIATNLDEADGWAGDVREEEALLSIEAAATGADDAMENLRQIALKIAEIDARKVVAK